MDVFKTKHITIKGPELMKMLAVAGAVTPAERKGMEVDYVEFERAYRNDDDSVEEACLVITVSDKDDE